MSVKFQDYYQTLGVARDASDEDIRKAYRALARKTHPDIDKTSGAAERFKQISEAYEVLKDPATRKRYDQLGANWKEGQEFTPPPGYDFGAGRPRARRTTHTHAGGFEGFSSFFEQMFGDRFSGRFDDGAFEFQTQSAPRRGASVEARLSIPLEDALKGAKRTLHVQSEEGSAPRTIEVTIPAGTTNGTVMRLRGQGAPGQAGAGDLLLRVEIEPHARFAVDGHDLAATLDIPPHQAALGARVPFTSAEGSELTLTVPPGSSSGKKLRLRGQGLSRRDGSRGDLIVALRIVVPETLSDEERKLYEELARAARPSDS
jgi:curved DNA-binding protein